MKLNDAQYKAFEHLDAERVRYERMAVRLRSIGMTLLAATCSRFASELKTCLELQVRVIQQDERLLWMDLPQHEDVKK